MEAENVSPCRLAFRPWVRSTCRKAMIGGLGVLTLLVGVAWLLRSPDEGAFGRAFAVQAAYGVLFWATLLKIWWTAGGVAVEIDASCMAYQPLHTFSLRYIPIEKILACGPRPGTESLRFVVEGLRRDKEFFLNLAVVQHQHRFLDVLGESLTAAGLERVASEQLAWKRPDWEEDGAPTSSSEIR